MVLFFKKELLLCFLAVAAAPEAKVQQVSKSLAEGILGQSVTDDQGAVMGHIVDVLIGPGGAPQAAVVNFSGFFGLGDRAVAVTWKALNFAVDHDRIVISVALDAEKLKAMPEYKPEAASVAVATPAKPH